jgi:pimeloyl-ACP methyl ester carboxylesterase
VGQFTAFASERRVVAWNAPGYGDATPLASEAPDARDYAGALLGLLDNLGIARCVLVGQSLGAIMVSAAARIAPRRIAALVLASPATGYGVAFGAALPETITRRIEDIRALGPQGMADQRAMRLVTEAASPQVRALVHGAMAAVTLEGYEKAVRLLACSDLPTLLDGVSLPGLVIWGGADVVTPPAGCQRIADAFAGAARHEVPGLGHAFATEAPDQFNAAIRPVLAAADKGN